MAVTMVSSLRVDRAADRLAPFGTAFLLLLLDLAPAPFSAQPSLALCAVFFWSVARPDLFGFGAAFALGLIHDAVGGGPMGATALIFVAARALAAESQRYLASRAFAVAWACFALLAVLASASHWAIGSLFAQRPLALGAPAAQAALSFAAYPFVDRLCAATLQKRGRRA